VSNPNVYNPLEKANLAQSIVSALFDQPVRRLTDTTGLVGAGVYAIYYTGPFPLYGPVTALNAQKPTQPIYVGKAIPKGGRKGGLSTDSGVGTALRDRLRIHMSSIAQAANLDLEDFTYQALVVDDVWIPLGENAIIEWLKPVWNLALDGFGIKVPGRGRLNQRRSEWDTLHPGRGLAEGLPPNSRTVQELSDRVTRFLAGDTNAVSVATSEGDQEAPGSD
jgi:hypothetical protein